LEKLWESQKPLGSNERKEAALAGNIPK